MRVIRVRYQDKTFYGSLIGEAVHCLNKSLGFEELVPLRDIVVLPPVAPTKIICTQINYRTLAAELDLDLPSEPSLFLKPPSAVIGSGQQILLPSDTGRVDIEGQLAIVMGKLCHGVAPGDVPGYIFGYCCANDVTSRDIKSRDGLLCRSKGFDTFAPLGPWIETHVENPSDLSIKTYVNGKLRQSGHTSDMIFDPFELVSFISRTMTLNPGDVIMTGTPPGVGSIGPGDDVRVEIDEVGLLINSVMSIGAKASAHLIQ